MDICDSERESGLKMPWHNDIVIMRLMANVNIKWAQNRWQYQYYLYKIVRTEASAQQ